MTDIPPATAVDPRLIPPTPRGTSLPVRINGPVTYTPTQAVEWIAQLAEAMHTNPRLPVTTETIRHDNGTLTIHVTPHDTD